MSTQRVYLHSLWERLCWGRHVRPLTILWLHLYDMSFGELLFIISPVFDSMHWAYLYHHWRAILKPPKLYLHISLMSTCSHWTNVLPRDSGYNPKGKTNQRPHLDLFDMGKLSETVGKLTELPPCVTLNSLIITKILFFHDKTCQLLRVTDGWEI